MNSNISKRLLIETMLTLSRTEQVKNIRICDITDTVGFSKRVFFYHFKSRRDFLNKVLEYIFSDHRLCGVFMSSSIFYVNVWQIVSYLRVFMN